MASKKDRDDPPSVRKAVGQVIVDFVGKPFRELGELVASEVRLFRWQRAVSIMKKARRICDENGIPESEIPIKFLVPFIEEASCEQEGENIEEMWANLLASARKKYKPEYRSFISILSELDPNQVLTLNIVMDPISYKGRDPALANVEFIRESDIIHDIENGLATTDNRKQGTFRNLFRQLYKKYFNVGFVWEDISIEHLGRAPHARGASSSLLSGLSRGPECDLRQQVEDVMTCFDLLQRQFLLKNFAAPGVKVGDKYIYAFGAYRVTSLGVDFYRACTGQHLKEHPLRDQGGRGRGKNR